MPIISVDGCVASTCFEKCARPITFSLAHTRILPYLPSFTLSDNLNTNRTKNKPVTSSNGRLQCWNSGKLCEHAQCAELPSFGSSYCFSRSLTVFIYFRVFKWLHFVITYSSVCLSSSLYEANWKSSCCHRRRLFQHSTSLSILNRISSNTCHRPRFPIFCFCPFQPGVGIVNCSRPLT